MKANLPRTAAAAALCLALALAGGCKGKEEKHREASRHTEGVILALGDSLTAGLGVDPAEAWPAGLERRLAEAGYDFRVINAGVSGETSSGCLARIDWVLRLEPDIVILETGANDGLRGIDPALTLRNLEAILDRLAAGGAITVLAGMRMVTNLGGDYTRAFAAVYPEAASRHGAILIPFLLEGVAADPTLNQDDGIHPTAAGYRVVTDTVYPYVLRAIEEWRKRKTAGG